MSKQKKSKKKKKQKLLKQMRIPTEGILKCPACQCNKLVRHKSKVHRFPKIHLIKFECGFAYLYNTKTEEFFHDIDWMCKHQKDECLEWDTDKYRKLTKEYLEGEKIRLKNEKLLNKPIKGALKMKDKKNKKEK